MSSVFVMEKEGKLTDVEIILRLNGILPCEPERVLFFDVEETEDPDLSKNRIQRALGKANCYSLKKFSQVSSELILDY